MRADENRTERITHARFEILGGAAAFIKRHECRHVFIGQRTPERAFAKTGDDLARTRSFFCRFLRITHEDVFAAFRFAHAGDFKWTTHLQRMHGMYTILAPFQRRDTRELIAFREAALYERDGDGMLPCSGIKTNTTQTIVDLGYRIVLYLVDRLVIGFAADVGAEKFHTIKQCHDSVFEFHVGHFAREREIADRQFILAIGKEVVLDAHAAACTERHTFVVALLRAGAWRAARWQRNNHVCDVAVGFHHGNRTTITHGIVCNGACGVEVLVDEGR